MPTPQDGPWTKYAAPAGDGPWTKYAQPPAEGGENSPTPTPTMSASPASQHPVQDWLRDLETDVTEGGNRTLPGRVMGKMQGRGDAGYAGMRQGGMSDGVIDFMGSPVRGPIHAAQGMAETPEHPVAGTLKTLGGLAETATIPSMMAMPEANPAVRMGKAAWDKVPTTGKAGKLLDSVLADAGNQPVSMARTKPILERAMQLSDTGHGTITPLDKLYSRINQTQPLDYAEARDRYSALSNLTGEDKMRATKTLQSQAKQLTHAFREDIGDAASAVGRGEDYQKGMRQYRMASGLKEGAKATAKYGAGVAAGATVGPKLWSYLKSVM